MSGVKPTAACYDAALSAKPCYTLFKSYAIPHCNQNTAALKFCTIVQYAHTTSKS